VGHDAVPDFSTYYQKLAEGFYMDLYVKPDPSEPWENAFQKKQWEKKFAGLDETDFDWVPWSPLEQNRHRHLSGRAHIPLTVIPMQKHDPMRLMPLHYLSDDARQPVFVEFSNIADLRSMSPEERDLIAPLAQPSIKVFWGEELVHRYFISFGLEDYRPILYVGDTWINKVLPALATEGQRNENIDHLPVVQ